MTARHLPDPDEQPIRRRLDPEPERSPWVVLWLLLAAVVAVALAVAFGGVLWRMP